MQCRPLLSLSSHIIGITVWPVSDGGDDGGSGGDGGAVGSHSGGRCISIIGLMTTWVSLPLIS